MDKFLICGLGNPGAEYQDTRHNTGFMVLDAFAKASNIVFEDKRYGFVAETSIKGRKVFLLKPTTFMNLSGNAVRYWLNKENIDQKRLLVISDDVALPVGAFRLKANGSNGGQAGAQPVSMETIPVAPRSIGYWADSPMMTCSSSSPASTLPSTSSRALCWLVLTSP